MKQNVWAIAVHFNPCSCSRDHHQTEYGKKHIKKTHAHLIFMATENYLCPLNFMCTWSVMSNLILLNVPCLLTLIWFWCYIFMHAFVSVLLLYFHSIVYYCWCAFVVKSFDLSFLIRPMMCPAFISEDRTSRYLLGMCRFHSVFVNLLHKENSYWKIGHVRLVLDLFSYF